MKRLKVISSLLAITMVCSVTASSMFAATTVTSGTTANISGQANSELSDKLIETASKYIKIKNNKFVINAKLQKAISKDELALVKKYVDSSNKRITEILNETQNNSSLSIKMDSEKVVMTQYSTNSTNGGISLQAINKSSLWDYELKWWGPRVYLSNKFITTMSAWKDSIFAVYGAGVAGYSALLVKAGMASTPAGWIAAALSIGGAITVNRIETANTGSGVYLDGSWASLSPFLPGSPFYLTKIYGA